MSSPALKRKATELAASSAKKPKQNASITSFFSQPKPKAVDTTATPTSSTTSTGAASESTTTTTAAAATTTTTASTPYNPIPAPKKAFDKAAWLAKLSDEQKELLKLEIESLHESWLPYLADEITSKEFLELKRFLKKEVEKGVKVFPPMEDVYSW